ncbi:hypothetical protein P5673_026301 [Acropora cervicornis]|uniref:UFSP2 second domain-containing protein n=1 Tax=Acropora cervicornis TaxID=6130 RepID=A0AAD9Q0P1_ACRCE|nr:hypothetical protein P5673_026301 [Acropora cervicornis]
MADGELQIFVDKSIKQRLRENVKNPEDTEVNSVFYLYGETLQSKVYVVGCLACRRFITVPKNGYPAIPDWKNEQDELCCLIPNGLQLCGIYYCCVKETNLEASELQRFYDGLSLKGDSGKQVVVQYCSSSNGQKCFIYNKNLRSISECECQEADILGEFWEQRICFRLQACIPVLVGKDERGSSPDVMNKIKKACQELSSASSVFYIKDCNILLKNRDSVRGEKETCDDLVMKMESSDQQGHSKGRGKQKSGKMSSSTNTTKIKNVLDVRFLNQLTATDENSKANHVPVIHFQKCISSQVKLNLSLDIVFFVSKETLLTSLPDLFTSAMSNQLGRMGSVIKEFSKGPCENTRYSREVPMATLSAGTSPASSHQPTSILKPALARLL